MTFRRSSRTVGAIASVRAYGSTPTRKADAAIYFFILLPKLTRRRDSITGKRKHSTRQTTHKKHPSYCKYFMHRKTQHFSISQHPPIHGTQTATIITRHMRPVVLAFEPLSEIPTNGATYPSNKNSYCTEHTTGHQPPHPRTCKIKHESQKSTALTPINAGSEDPPQPRQKHLTTRLNKTLTINKQPKIWIGALRHRSTK